MTFTVTRRRRNGGFWRAVTDKPAEIVGFIRTAWRAREECKVVDEIGEVHGGVLIQEHEHGKWVWWHSWPEISLPGLE